jgi:hypothetical protein
MTIMATAERKVIKAKVGGGASVSEIIRPVWHVAYAR